MKIIYLITSIFLLILTGCYSTYNVSDFSSKDKFYEDFNKSANDKALKVTLSNDSSFFISNGAEIVNDTLYYLGKEINSGNKRIAVSDIKELNYTSNDYKSASILLKNGESYRAKEIKMGKDSIEFAFTQEVITQNKVTSINNIQKISYKNRWLGVIPGSIAGTLLGFVIGVATISPGTPLAGELEGGTPANFASVPIGTFSGLILGSAFGWFMGFNYKYQFNP
ncbi:MAG: hypothetical protein ACYDA4_08510 [Ignavibacteriaceae bacterium]